MEPGVLLIFLFFFNDTPTTEIYTLSLHDALPISTRPRRGARGGTRLGQDLPGRARGDPQQDRRPDRGEPRVDRRRRNLGQRQTGTRNAECGYPAGGGSLPV